MTRADFIGQFQRLCAGFKHEATEEQTEAWYRRIGQIAVSVWAESVTTLLCAKYFPKLDEVLHAIDREAEAQRKLAVQRQQMDAQKTYVLLHQPVNEADASRIPTPGTPLYACIKAFAGRDHIRHTQRQVMQRETLDAKEKPRLLRQLGEQEAALNAELMQWSDQIHPDDLRRLLDRYEAEAA